MGAGGHKSGFLPGLSGPHVGCSLLLVGQTLGRMRSHQRGTVAASGPGPQRVKFWGALQTVGAS